MMDLKLKISYLFIFFISVHSQLHAMEESTCSTQKKAAVIKVLRAAVSCVTGKRSRAVVSTDSEVGARFLGTPQSFKNELEQKLESLGEKKALSKGITPAMIDAQKSPAKKEYDRFLKEKQEKKILSSPSKELTQEVAQVASNLKVSMPVLKQSTMSGPAKCIGDVLSVNPVELSAFASPGGQRYTLAHELTHIRYQHSLQRCAMIRAAKIAGKEHLYSPETRQYIYRAQETTADVGSLLHSKEYAAAGVRIWARHVKEYGEGQSDLHPSYAHRLTLAQACNEYQEACEAEERQKKQRTNPTQDSDGQKENYTHKVNRSLLEEFERVEKLEKGSR